jgi:hypothetical protein
MRPAQHVLLAITLVVCVPGLCQAQQKKDADKEKVQPGKVIGGRTLNQWIDCLRDGDPGLREMAMQVVPQFGGESYKAARAIINELRDRDPSLRANAAYSLGQISLDRNDLSAAVTALAGAMSDPQAIVRFRSATTLGIYGRHGREALPQLIAGLKDQAGAWEVRKAAAFAVGSVGIGQGDEGPNMQAAQALVQAVKQDTSAEVRREAVQGLARLGKPTQARDVQWLRTALRQAINDRDRAVDVWARVALVLLDKTREHPGRDGDAQIAAIRGLLRNSDPMVRAHAAQALGTLGPDAAAAVPELTSALDDKEDGVVLSALTALQSIGSAAQEALPRITELRRHRNTQVQAVATEMVEIFSRRAGQPVPPLNPKAKD